MGSIRTFNPVKLFVGVLVSEEGRLAEVESRLSAEYGAIELRSPVIPFTFTDYYRRETGDRILRTFFSFESLIDADRLPEIKHWTNALETEFAAAGGPSGDIQRPVKSRPRVHRTLESHPRIDKEFLSQNVSRQGDLRRGDDALSQQRAWSFSHGRIRTISRRITGSFFWNCGAGIAPSSSRCARSGRTE